MSDRSAEQAGVVAGMRRDWERRAADDPLYAIDSTRRRWSLDDFYARGPALVAQILDPVLAALAVDPAGMRVLEIGCGMGRLFAGLAARFGEVWGIDISSEMVERGRAHCPVEATWVVGDGSSLAGVGDASVDHVLSYEVFQHIPDPGVIQGYLREMARVLRPGGTFGVQMRRGSDTPRQAVVRALPRPLRKAAGAALHRMGILPVEGDVDTWLGCVVPEDQALAWARGAGLEDVACLADASHPRRMGYWLVGRRPLAAS